MKVHKFTLILTLIVMAMHVWGAWFQRRFISLVGESLATNIMIGVLMAALVTVIAWAVFNGHRDLLILALAGAVMAFLFFSRPVFAGRVSLFAFFLLGISTGLDEVKQAKWAPLLMISGCALLCEGIPALMGAVGFYWMDVLIMSLGGFSGRAVICSNR